MNADVIVVGAGAAGILAAWRAATLGAKVLLLEKTNRIGTKILVSGGGKCNIAHAGPLEEVLRAFRPAEARFLRPACYRLTNEHIVDLFTSRGLRTYTRPDGRVFPVDQTAKDVVAILRGYLEEAKVELSLESPVEEILVESGRVIGVRYRRASTQKPTADVSAVGYRPATAKNLLRELGPGQAGVSDESFTVYAERVVVCPGGSSYPNSGTTGDGYDWARRLGHHVEPIRAALAPIYLELDSEKTRSGVALRDVLLKARQGKEIARWRGDLLFTHQGVTGPAVLGLSRVVAERFGREPIQLEIDLAPEQTPEEVSRSLLSFTEAHPKRTLLGHLEDMVPTRLVDDLLESASLDRTIPNARLDRKSRNRIAERIKAWPIGNVRHVPLEKGEVVAGGVRLDEVDPQTMASKKIAGLFLCGEVLDIAGPVGGYNLQAAFATGYVAGESAAHA